jgi:His/Glu/Gln/Arg/opine family amino acid ABC transporter permease subunit
MSLSNFLSLLQGALLTLEISCMAIVFGIALGSLLGIFSCRYLRSGASSLVSIYVMILRGTPLFVQILIIYFGLPSLLQVNISPLVAGVLALGINSSAYIAEILRGAINALPLGQWEAAHLLGYSKVQMLRWIVLPQAMKNALPMLVNELTTLVKESSILMVLGVPELTKTSKDIVARELKPMEIYLAAAFMYFLMTSALSFVAKKIEEKKYAH